MLKQKGATRSLLTDGMAKELPPLPPGDWV